jgi:acyl-[acyl-carrier-protein]-phospholipid O-acyltransferase / long-chain-fatty-acid--[acyl-carrier-protein] ligase
VVTCFSSFTGIAAWTGPVTVGVVLLALLICWLRPSLVLRLFLRLLGRTLYRVRTSGLDHVPAQGGTLLVCNQVHFLDWLLLWAALPRPTRFVVFAGWTRRWGVRHLLRWTGAITLDDQARARNVVKALRAATEALSRGELVCLFAEETRSPSGLSLPFSRVYRQVTRRAPVPILPVSLFHRWGSLFRVQNSRISWFWPQQVPIPVWVDSGTLLPPGTPATNVRQALQDLTSQAAFQRGDTLLPVHREFVRTACRHPFRSCLHDSSTGTSLTYGKTLAGAMCLSRHLRSLLGDERMIGVWLPPGAGGAFSNIALALLGRTAVNLNYTFPAESVQAAIRQSGVRKLLTARRFTARVPLDPGPGVELIFLDDLLPRISSGEKLRAFLKILLLPRLVVERWILGLHRHKLDDLATVIFSSGSTGEPKGVMLSHRNVAANVEAAVERTGVAPTDRALGILPFFHSFGYTVTLWVPLCRGASAVYHPDPRQAREVGELCRTHRCTILLNTATFLRFCLRKCEPDDFRTLRLLICGAEKLPPALGAEIQARFGIQPMEGYGCTELSPTVGTNMPDEDLGGWVRVNNRIGTVGPPLPGISAYTIDPETQTRLAAGQEGLLVIHAPSVMQGYLGRPELTEKVKLANDYDYITGDMARVDADGFITLTGRLARFAKVGGEMVPLEKTEEELHALLGTTDRVLTVAAVPDDKKGERIVVLHLPHESINPRRLTRGLTDRGLPNLWVPAERDFFPVEELPCLGTGKLDLQLAQEMALRVVRGIALPQVSGV